MIVGGYSLNYNITKYTNKQTAVYVIIEKSAATLKINNWTYNIESTDSYISTAI